MGSPQPVRKSDLKREAQALAKKKWSGKARRDDPRLGALLRDLDPDAATVREAAEHLSAGRLRPAQRSAKRAQMRDLVKTAKSIRRLAVVEEVEAVAAAVLKSKRDWQVVELRLGLRDGAPKTLQDTGERLEVTRERVRQIEKRFSDRLASRSVWAPAFSATVRRLRRAVPLTEEEAWELLREERLLEEDGYLPFQSLVRLAELFRVELPFELGENRLLPTGTAEAISAIGSTARKLIVHWGTTTVDELRATLEEAGKGPIDDQTARAILESVAGFRWLDEDEGWFWIKGESRNRLLNQVEKIVSVAGAISIGELRDGVGRHHRMKGFRPPREILARLCVDTGLYERRGDLVVGRSDLPDWRTVLGRNETTIVSILFEEGPVMRREDIERRAVEVEGLNRNSFYIYLTYSPVLERFAPGVFGLRGAQVTAAEVKAMIPPRVRTQVLQDHGWTSGGEVWIAYKVSQAGVVSGVLGVPAVLDDLLRGSFTLTSEDGRRVGTVVVDDNMWGLSPFFRRWGVEAGDYVVVTFDLRNGAATISTGTEELLLRFQKGE